MKRTLAQQTPLSTKTTNRAFSETMLECNDNYP